LSQPDGKLVAGGFSYDNDSNLDFAIVRYFGGTCGNDLAEGGEQCDSGLLNGTLDSCCSMTCQFQPAGAGCADEGNLCTSDKCDGAGNCAHAFEPATNCTLAGPRAGSIKLVNNPTRSSARFKWTKGPAVTLNDFGIPNGGTVYELCIYDEANGAASNMYHGQPGGPGVCGTAPCWIERPTGWNFKSRSGAPDGIVAVRLKVGEAGKGRVQMSAKSNDLTFGTFPLQALPRVVAQMRASTEQCWGANFSTGIRRNDSVKFVAKSD